MTDALKQHWPDYLMEAACLGLFMISAFTFGAILEHPASLIHKAIPNPLLRRFLMGLAMGSTAIAIIYSPWGKQSGAHINPSTTLTFFRLGKVATWDAVFYIVAQFVGGTAGALLASAVLAGWVSHPAVNYVVHYARCRWGRHCVPGRGCDCLCFNDGHTAYLQQPSAAQTHRTLRGRIGSDLHYLRSSDLRHEHESRAHLRVGRVSAALDGFVDLFHSAADRHVLRRRSVFTEARG